MEKIMQLKLNIKMQRIADLLCSAMEGGINYWAQIEKYKEPSQPVDLTLFEDDLVIGKTVYKHIHYPLTPDGAVIIKDIEGNENKKYKLDRKAIKKGLNIFAEKYPVHFGNWLSEDDDAITGDVFVQCCLFGEVVYG